MNENLIARRYALALAEVCSESNTFERVGEEMRTLVDILEPGRGDVDVPELLAILRAPTTPEADKIHITDVMLKKLDFSEETSNLLNILIRRNRLGLISRIETAFAESSAKLRNIQVAQVESARPLGPTEMKRIQEALVATTGSEVTVENAVEPSLIGGVRIRMGAKLIDGAVSGALDRLERRLTR